MADRRTSRVRSHAVALAALLAHDLPWSRRHQHPDVDDNPLPVAPEAATRGEVLMALPFVPEPVECLRARYAAATGELIEIDSVRLGTALRAGEQRRNVFDSEDSLRLLISREDLGRGPVLHVSASVQSETPAAEKFRWGVQNKGLPWACEGLKKLAEARFREVSGEARPLVFIGFSDGGVPHWIIEEKAEAD